MAKDNEVEVVVKPTEDASVYSKEELEYVAGLIGSRPMRTVRFLSFPVEIAQMPNAFYTPELVLGVLEDVHGYKIAKVDTRQSPEQFMYTIVLEKAS